jgi:16S rRNA (cytidine1402-2'-O)-methyltransferase
MTGTLYIVSTPIGNLEDITLRAIRVLKEVDLIAAEDTRRARVLLDRFGIQKETTSFHSHSMRGKQAFLIKKLQEGTNIALISDSGTPGISDPGHVLVGEAIRNGIPLTAVPGPSAFVAGLVVSGHPTNKFVFEGFLSNKGARRRKQLKALLEEERTVVLYESPHRIEKFLADFMKLAGERDITLVREMTKKFEEIRRGPAREHIEHFRKNRPRGEFVLVF